MRPSLRTNFHSNLSDLTSPVTGVGRPRIGTGAWAVGRRAICQYPRYIAISDMYTY